MNVIRKLGPRVARVSCRSGQLLLCGTRCGSGPHFLFHLVIPNIGNLSPSLNGSVYQCTDNQGDGVDDMVRRRCTFLRCYLYI